MFLWYHQTLRYNYNTPDRRTDGHSHDHYDRFSHLKGRHFLVSPLPLPQETCASDIRTYYHLCIIILSLGTMGVRAANGVEEEIEGKASLPHRTYRQTAPTAPQRQPPRSKVLGGSPKAKLWANRTTHSFALGIQLLHIRLITSCATSPQSLLKQ
jgi:hypothetical protein